MIKNISKICPVCKQPVKVSCVDKERNVYSVGCHNQECSIQPFVFESTLKDVLSEWENMCKYLREDNM